jgi:xanthine dehydrogenase iron-sulfur cluster and FAD-binding subunit A
LNSLIQESVLKQEKKLALEIKKNQILNKINTLNEEGNVAPVVGGQAPASPISDKPAMAEKQESIFDAKPGETVIFNFQDVTIKVQRQLDDLFKVTDASESKKLKDGDYIKIQGNDTLANGKKFKFVILRQALNYESNPLMSWKVIKN